MATVVGLFDSTSQAQAAVEQLRSSGIAASDIGVAMRSGADATTTDVVTTDTGAAGGAVTGAVGGGVLGGLAGLLVGIGALAIPGVGPIVAAGPLATTLVGAGIGAATGGLLGALVDAGVPEEEAAMYQTGVERGGVLVTARVPDGQEANAQQILNGAGARDIRNESTRYSDPNYRYGGMTTTTSSNYGTTGRHDDKTGEAVGGGAGALAGGIIGGVVAGPPGAVAGAAIGGAGGAVAADKAQGDDDSVGAGTGGAGGAIAGGAIGGAIGGPIGAAAGAAIGAGAGAAGGEKAEEEVKDDTGMRDVEPYDTNVSRNYDDTTRTDTTY
jgi:hypothetical protein